MSADLSPGQVIGKDDVAKLRAGDVLRQIEDGHIIHFDAWIDRREMPFDAFTFIGRPGPDGFIPWTGGENPVGDAVVEIKRRDGQTLWSGPHRLDWLHDPRRDDPADIIAFRLSPPAGSANPETAGPAASFWANVVRSPSSKTEHVAGDAVSGAVERAPVIHDLKCWPEPFAAVRAGLKTWELRKNDRDYRVGDTLRQREWSPETEAYTGDTDEQVVTWALYGPAFGLPDGYVIMSIQPPAQAAEIADLKARNKALEEGLRPIAVHAKSFIDAAPETLAASITVTVGDLRRARTLTEADHGR